MGGTDWAATMSPPADASTEQGLRVAAPDLKAASPKLLKSGFAPFDREADDGNAACVEAPLSAFDTDITPTRQFFVRSHFPVPNIDPDRWRLTIGGEVETGLSLSLDDLRRLPQREIVVTMECAGNSRSSMTPRADGVLWGNGAVGTARWSGVPLAEVLRWARPRAGACEIVLSGADHGSEPGTEEELNFEMSIPTAKAAHPDTILAVSMNGQPLEPRHGYPLRAIVPGWYGMASVKWLTRISAVSTPFTGFFRGRAYTFIREGAPTQSEIIPAQEARVKSLITWPHEHAVLPPGRHTIRGVAWCGDSSIETVEVSGVSSRDGPEAWRPARVRPAVSGYSWVRWEAEVELPIEGFSLLRVRATDARGRTQPPTAEWNYRGLGNNSIHCVPIEVRAPG